VNGTSNSKGAAIGIVLTTLEEYIIEYSFSLGFPLSNNEAEYKAYHTQSHRARVQSDFSLVINQVSSE